MLRVMYLLSKFTDMALDGLTWTAARSAVDAVRFQGGAGVAQDTEESLLVELGVDRLHPR